jgi:hypothetical protein
MTPTLLTHVSFQTAVKLPPIELGGEFLRIHDVLGQCYLINTAN